MWGRELQAAMQQKLVHIHAWSHETATSSNLALLLPISTCRVLFACKLMTDSTSFGKEGYKDWKHAAYCVPRHERNAVHRDAMILLLQRSDAGCRVDFKMMRQANTSGIIGVLYLNEWQKLHASGLLSVAYYSVVWLRLLDPPQMVTTREY